MIFTEEEYDEDLVEKTLYETASRTDYIPHGYQKRSLIRPKQSDNTFDDENLMNDDYETYNTMSRTVYIPHLNVARVKPVKPDNKYYEVDDNRDFLSVNHKDYVIQPYSKRNLIKPEKHYTNQEEDRNFNSTAKSDYQIPTYSKRSLIKQKEEKWQNDLNHEKFTATSRSREDFKAYDLSKIDRVKSIRHKETNALKLDDNDATDTFTTDYQLSFSKYQYQKPPDSFKPKRGFKGYRLVNGKWLSPKVYRKYTEDQKKKNQNQLNL